MRAIIPREAAIGLSFFLGMVPAWFVFACTVSNFRPEQTFQQALFERIMIVALSAGIIGTIIGILMPISLLEMGIWINISNCIVLVFFIFMMMSNADQILSKGMFEVIKFIAWWIFFPILAYASSCFGLFAGASANKLLDKRGK